MVPESFSFFDLGANSRLTDDVRQGLINHLGEFARETSATINMEIRHEGFLERYYPDLFQLNKRLNKSSGVRAEHDAIKLTFRDAARKESPFDMVETIFHAPTGSPLLFKCRSRRDISGLLDTLKAKYGEPVLQNLEKDAGQTLAWRKNGDVLICSIFKGHYVDKEYDLMIGYCNRIEAMLKEEAEQASRREQKKNKGVKQVF
jgi:hypothetical protein